MELISHYLLQYGYIFLFFAFMVQMLGIPLPGEVIMGYVGYLVFMGKMDWLISIIVITLGLWVGITIAYYLGDKFGHPLLNKYGRYIHMKPEQLDALSQWFGKYGNKVLVVGLFIPVRPFIGIFAGIIEIPLRVFIIYSYLGSFLFAGTFISLGRYLGSDWVKYHALIEKYISIAAIIVAIILLIVYIFRYKGHIQDFIAQLLENSAERYNYSLLRVKIIAASVLAVFFSFVILMIGITQDYLSADFEQFNATVTLLISLLFNQNSLLLKWADYFTSVNMIAVAITFGVFWITIKSKERVLDMIFLLIALIGGQALKELLQFIFDRYGPVTSHAAFSFPSEQTFLVSVIWGYFIFLFLRYNGAVHVWLRSIVTLAFIIVIVMVGINHIILGLETPSDILAGYVFGTVWLFFNLILLEIVRLRTS